MSTAIPLSEGTCEIVRRFYPAHERQTILDALSSMDDESLREAVLILAFGDSARLFDLVKIGNNDFRDVVALLDERNIDGLKEEELNRRRRVLGLPIPLSENSIERFEERVKQYVSRKLLFPCAQLNSSTELQRDLKLQGADGERFIADFAAEFGVDLNGFCSQRHFQRKPGEHPFADFAAIVFGRRPPETTPVTIGELAAAARAKRWLKKDSDIRT